MNQRTILLKLFASYPRTPVTPETVLAYLERLQHVPVSELAAAVDRCIDAYPHLPGVAEILAHVSGEGAQKFLPAPLKTAAQLDEQREGRPAIPGVDATNELLKNVPDPFGVGYVIQRESKEERLERLRRTEGWADRYAH
jgi:hypothetical protein